MSFAWKRTSTSELLLALKTRLIDKLDFDPARVIISVLDPDDVPRHAADSDVVIHLMGEAADLGVIDGGGRYENRRTRRFQICCRTRLFLDETGADEQRLTHATLGHAQLEDAVVEALECVTLLSTGLEALCSPIRLVDLSDPKRMKEYDSDWVVSRFQAETQYCRDLDTSEWP